MKPSERNLLILLGIVAIFAVPYIAGLFDQGYGSDGDYFSEEKIAELKHKQSQLPAINLQLLDNEKENFRGSKRNLFYFGEAYNEAANDESAAEEEEDSEDDPYAVEETEDNIAEKKPVQRKLAGYQYMGYHITKETRTAAFEWRGQVFIGRLGDVINDAFEIKEIKEDFATILVKKGDFKQQLKLRSPVGSDGGN